MRRDVLSINRDDVCEFLPKADAYDISNEQSISDVVVISAAVRLIMMRIEIVWC